jgi:hypothetical protein
MEIFRGPALETEGCLSLLDHIKKRINYKPETLGADKGYFADTFLNGLFERKVEPHVAVKDRGTAISHKRVRMRERGIGNPLSQRCRKKIEELFGEGKENHGLRRMSRRTLAIVVQEVLLIGMVLNIKRFAAIRALA